MMSVQSVRSNNFVQQWGKRSSLPYSEQCDTQLGGLELLPSFFSQEEIKGRTETRNSKRNASGALIKPCLKLLPLTDFLVAIS